MNGLSYFLFYQVVLPALEHTSGDVRDPASRLILELYRKVRTVLNVLLQFYTQLTQMDEETIKATAYTMKRKRKRGESKFPPRQATARSDEMFNDHSF